MTINNYGELKAAIQTWMMDADEISGSLDVIVRLSQPYISLKLRAREMLHVADLTVASGEVTLPDDYVAPRRVVFTSGSTRLPLRQLTPDKADELYPDRPAGIPCHFAIVGNKLRLYPTVGEGTQVELTYYRKLAAFSKDEDTDWLLTGYPNVYLAAGQMYAAELLKDDAEAQKQAAVTDTFIAMINAQTEETDFDMGEYHAEGSPV
jgi:hypothetical protein